jgi:Tol biopolymer transport system component
MHQENGVWSDPDIIPDASGPVVTEDGSRVYYNSIAENGTIRSILKHGNGWDKPEILGLIARFPEVKHAYNLSFASNGNLYFLGHAKDLGSKNDFGIYRSELKDGVYQKPELLPEPINIGDGTLNWTPFISPSESYLLFSSSRSTGKSDLGDIYLCFRKRDGSWSKAYNLGNEINTDRQERFPSVSPDGKYLFFTRWVERGNEDVMWVSASVLDLE